MSFIYKKDNLIVKSDPYDDLLDRVLEEITKSKNTNDSINDTIKIDVSSQYWKNIVSLTQNKQENILYSLNNFPEL